MLHTLLVVLAVILLIGMLPAWPYSASWGYAPSGTLFLLAIVALVIMMSNRRRGDIL